MRAPQPIPYQGSKRRIAGTILRFFPQHVPRIVEPFAGSAALSIAAAMENRADAFWINDIHHPLIALWQEIIDHPEDISNSYSSLWSVQLGRERKFFDEVRQRFNQDSNPSDFLYLLARCVKAAVRYNSNGEFNNSPDNRRRGARPKEMAWRISAASKLLGNRTQLTSNDYKDVLHACSEEDLVYMDPPYQGVSGTRDGRYYGEFNHEEFCSSLADLVRRDIMFAVSYDGRTGTKTYGNHLPCALNLTRVEISAGPSSQATLLGRTQPTIESLYLSPALLLRCNPTILSTGSGRELVPKEQYEDLMDRVQV